MELIKENLESLEEQYWVALEEDWFDMAFKVSVTAMADLQGYIESGSMKDRVAEGHLVKWGERTKFCLNEVKEQYDSNMFDTEN